MNNPEYSSALSSFSHKYDQNDKFMNTNFKYKILGINGSDFINKLNLPKPDYIKIDVDGAEHLIIKGFDNNVFENQDFGGRRSGIGGVGGVGGVGGAERGRRSKNYLFV